VFRRKPGPVTRTTAAAPAPPGGPAEDAAGESTVAAPAADVGREAEFEPQKEVLPDDEVPPDDSAFDPALGPRFVLHGAPDPDILVAGHSHALTLLHAVRAGNGPTRLTGAVAYNRNYVGAPATDASYWDFVEQNAGDRHVAILWSGNYHLADFLLADGPSMRVYDPRVPARSSAEGTWVPRTMLREHWEHSFDELDQLLPRLRAKARSVIVVSTPPPKRDDHVRVALRRERYFLDQAAAAGVDIDEIPLTAEPDRLAMWYLLQDMLREHALAGGAAFLPVPSDALDSEGFLRPDFSRWDVTHANPRFGQLLWAALENEIEGEQP